MFARGYGTIENFPIEIHPLKALPSIKNVSRSCLLLLIPQARDHQEQLLIDPIAIATHQHLSRAATRATRYDGAVSYASPIGNKLMMIKIY